MSSFLPKEENDENDRVAFITSDAEAISWRIFRQSIEQQKQIFGNTRKLIALEAHRSFEMIVDYFAALEEGHAVALLSSNNEKNWSGFQNDFHPDFSIRYEDGSQRIIETHQWENSSKLHPDLTLLLSTSGSTGKGKFVRLSKQNILANTKAICSYMNLTENDRSALVLPLHYSYGLSVLHAHILVGGSVFLNKGSIKEESFLKDLQKAECTNISGVPHTYSLLEETSFHPQKVPTLRFMTVAGGRLNSEITKKYNDMMKAQKGTFFVMYGQTEATSRISFVPPDKLLDNEKAIGEPVPGGALHLVDDEGNILEGPDKEGELIYRGQNIMMGYAQSFEDLSQGHKFQELRTGDLAVREKNGFFRITGRLKRISKISGLRISHDALEAILANQNIEAAITGDDTEILVQHTSNIKDEAVTKILVEESALPAFCFKVERIETIKRLSSGKVDYESIKNCFKQNGAIVKTDILNLFRQTFPKTRLTKKESFVSLGGDSLCFVQLSMQLEKHLGHVPVNWEKMTIADLEKQHFKENRNLTIGTDLIIRALAILLVVVHHATHWPIPGGAAAMTVLIGFSLARFHSDAVVKGDVMRLLGGIPLVLLPYFVVLAGYSIAWHEVPWASVLFMGNFGMAHPLNHTMLPFLYWFVEIYVQSILIVFALFLVPQIRAFARQNAFHFALGLLLFGLLLRFVLAEFWGFGGREIFTISWNFYLIGFGWAVFIAKTQKEKIILVILACLTMPAAAYFGGNWTPSWVKYTLQIPVVLLLLFLPTIKLPRFLALATLSTAAAGYHIYLFHRILPKHFPELLGKTIAPDYFMIVSILVGILSGFMMYHLQKILLSVMHQQKGKHILLTQ